MANKIKVGDSLYSNYFGAQIRVTKIVSDNDWYFTLDGESILQAGTPLSHFQKEKDEQESDRDHMDWLAEGPDMTEEGDK